MKIQEYRKLVKKKNKYRNIHTTVDGIRFSSKREAARYDQLKFLEKHGKISELVLQPEFPIRVCGELICNYRGDFSYWYGIDRVIEDVKGFKTPVYRLKKKLLKAVLGLEVTEI